MRTVRNAFVALLLCILMACGGAFAAGLSYEIVPHVLRPGKYYDFVVNAPAAGTASLQLLDAQGAVSYTIYQDYPLMAGSNTMTWDGTRLDHSVIEQGEFTIRLAMNGGESVDSPIRIGAPYPMITNIQQSSPIVDHETSTEVSYTTSEAGSVQVNLVSYLDHTTKPLGTVSVSAGDNAFRWDGLVDGVAVDAGQYALALTLQAAATGNESMEQYVMVEVLAEETIEIDNTETGFILNTTSAPEETATPEPTPEPTPSVSAPYSSYKDDTFWSMTPGELDDQVIWDILMQPITVYDGGIPAGAKSHAYLMENPDGTGEQIAQLHTQSQGVHVIGEKNEYGYVLVEAFSNYDPDYQPTTDEEREHAFEIKQGYVKADHLKEVEVMTDIGFVIDKLTQRMYMFVDGKRETEFLIATGKITDNKYYNETINGEFITVSHTGGFWSGNMYCDMAIRINGGILLHEVPHKVNADGTKNYSSFEAYLGTKQSHGCVRIQRLKNDEGYNHRWLWENLRKGKPYKVIIWDNANRVDEPTTWYENPKN